MKGATDPTSGRRSVGQRRSVGKKSGKPRTQPARRSAPSGAARARAAAGSASSLIEAETSDAPLVEGVANWVRRESHAAAAAAARKSKPHGALTEGGGGGGGKGSARMSTGKARARTVARRSTPEGGARARAPGSMPSPINVESSNALITEGGGGGGGHARSRSEGNEAAGPRKGSRTGPASPRSPSASSPGGSVAESMENILVGVRMRPMNKGEAKRGEQTAWECKGKTVRSSEEFADDGDTAGSSKVFHFDHVFGPDADNTEVYEKIGNGVVESVMQGYNGVIFACKLTRDLVTHTPRSHHKERAMIVSRLSV